MYVRIQSSGSDRAPPPTQPHPPPPPASLQVTISAETVFFLNFLIIPKTDDILLPDCRNSALRALMCFVIITTCCAKLAKTRILIAANLISLISAQWTNPMIFLGSSRRLMLSENVMVFMERHICLTIRPVFLAMSDNTRKRAKKKKIKKIHTRETDYPNTCGNTTQCLKISGSILLAGKQRSLSVALHILASWGGRGGGGTQTVAISKVKKSIWSESLIRVFAVRIQNKMFSGSQDPVCMGEGRGGGRGKVGGTPTQKG